MTRARTSDADGSGEFERVREIIAGIRHIRGEYGIPPSQVIPAVLLGAADLARRPLRSICAPPFVTYR